MKIRTLVNMTATATILTHETARAVHIDQRPVSLLIGRTHSVTFIGGEKVPPSAKYPGRAEYLRRVQVEAMIGAEHQTIEPALTMGDCQAAFQ